MLARTCAICRVRVLANRVHLTLCAAVSYSSTSKVTIHSLDFIDAR